MIVTSVVVTALTSPICKHINTQEQQCTQRLIRTLLFLAILLSMSLCTTPTSHDTADFYRFPGMYEDTYTKLGDINVGAIVMVALKQGTVSIEGCKKTTRLTPFTTDSSEAVAFAVEMINRDPNILPNVTLGFVVRGSCYNLGPSLATALPFIQRDIDTSNACDENSNCTSENVNSTCPGSSLLSHDVIGVLAPGQSSITQPISSLYSIAQLPIIGAVETSDILSDKYLHPYFFRIVAPETYQVKAMLRFISANNWTYISVLYEDCYYNPIAAFDYLQHNVGRYGICLAISLRMSCSVDYDKVVTDLLNNPRARVVVLFMANAVYRKVMKKMKERNVTRHFVFIGPGFGYSGIDGNASPEDPGVGTFVFSTYTTYVPEFYDYLRRQNVTTTNSPWLKPLWEWMLECSYDDQTCDLDADVLQSSRYRTYKGTALRIDAILSLAHAAHNLLSDICPNKRGKEARACITGDLLRQYMRRTSFNGSVGPVEFDENQDVKGKYLIGQFVYDYESYPYLPNTYNNVKGMAKKEIGYYDSVTDSITYFDNKILWDHLDKQERIVPWTFNAPLPETPESVCSRPCVEGEYKIEKEVSCCWECRRCRDNERLVHDEDINCQACPQFTWPDKSSGLTTCSDITPTYPLFTDNIPIVLTLLAMLALLVNVFIAVVYYLNREKRVIKASSRELSFIQLVAIFVGYVTIIIFQLPPNDVICSAIFFLFSLSFVLIYSPLLVKTIRIFRIFKSGKKNEKPKFISQQSQILFSLVLILIQCVLCGASYVLYSPGARKLQPIWTQNLVELACDLTHPGLASFLGYNVILVSLCSIFAFMVRKLPDNFNESKFISMCVSTTLLIWLAFIPSYFTADRLYIRTFLLSVALLLNHSVVLIFLFVPKIYAAKFLPDN